MVHYKNAAASSLARRRWQGISARERKDYASKIVQIREKKRKRGRTVMKTVIEEARIPTWLKIKLLGVQSGRRNEDRSYLDVGYHLGHYHLEDFCDDEAQVSGADENEVLSHPSRVLRRIFASESHPRGELTDLVPVNRRREFLLGVLAGAFENEPGEGWLALS
jgi:hypothetical protein